MNKIIAASLTIILLSFMVAAPMKLADAVGAFSDNFSSGNFNQWSRSFVISGASQTVSDQTARFIVPPPVAGASTYSYLVKDGFTSTVNSTIVASQDVLVTNVPNGCTQGNGAIFFLYICDSTNLNGNYGNVGVGIDGSTAWSLWIGGSAVYTYIFQTAGSPPVSNTWYHLVLTINNDAKTVSLAVNGAVVIAASQQQFTDKTHPISLMSGLGENWWSNSKEQLELQVDNVVLDISDSDALPTTVTTPQPAQATAPTQAPLPPPTKTITQTPTATSASPMPTHATPTPPQDFTLPLIQPVDGITCYLTVLQVTILAVLIALLAVMLWYKR
ncbi:MAG: hypothetical protein NWE93_14755 [Candidatus Bathyarchaeota archaeon]|nr:hypothetical protein [Candidatus Bathyarchaeota archaeon]